MRWIRSRSAARWRALSGSATPTCRSRSTRWRARPRFRTFLLAVFAVVALVLAVAGVYGVMAYTVSQRVPEIGIRVALGATPGNILGMVVGQGAKLAGIGLALGIVLALATTRLIEGLLFGVTARDPLILASVTAIVAAAALGACYIPGRRALRVEPMTALRTE
jgi:putative ABC transport system permease protein